MGLTFDRTLILVLSLALAAVLELVLCGWLTLFLVIVLESFTSKINEGKNKGKLGLQISYFILLAVKKQMIDKKDS